MRTTAFEPAAASGGAGATEDAPAAGDLPANSEFVGQELSKSDRPDLASAKVLLRYWFYAPINLSLSRWW